MEKLSMGFSKGSVIYLIKTDSLGNSGCNETIPATIVTAPATIVTTPATIVTSPATIVTTPPTVVGGGGTVTTLCTTGLTPALSTGEGVTVVPNPFNDELTVSLTPPLRGGWVGLYDIYGKEILSQALLSPNTELNTHNLKQGIYMYEVRNKEGVVKQGKLVKE
jgi:hypothetical protein